MAFTATLAASIKTDDGCGVSNSIAIASLTAKSIFDKILPIGTLDLAAYLADIPVQVHGIIIIATNGSFTISLDGTTFSIRKFSQFFVQVGDPGTMPLKITLTAQTRVQFMAVGL
jgi:hypothetical protein